MVTAADVAYHPPPPGDHEWAETTYLAFHVPEYDLCGSAYVVVRQGLGVAMADVTLFDRVSRDRRDCLHVDARQHLPAPADFADYVLPNGLGVTVMQAPRDYALRYEGSRDVGFDLRFEALMDPYDGHDDAAAGGGIAMYKGHYDMTGHVSGTLRVGDRELVVDCVDTMDHSWGPRPEQGGGIPGMCWMHAHFGSDLVVHAILMFDAAESPERQYRFVRGYVLEDGEVHAAVAAELRAVRVDGIAVGLALELRDARGRVHRLHGSAVAGTPVPWYSSIDAFHALHRWTHEDGRVGFGAAMEGEMLATVAGRRGLAIAPPTPREEPVA